jgi:hypothetical protein
MTEQPFSKSFVCRLDRFNSAGPVALISYLSFSDFSDLNSGFERKFKSDAEVVGSGI